MTFDFKSWSNWLFIIVLIGVIALRAPTIYEQFNKQGTLVNPVVISGQTIPKHGQKNVLIFWATWCGPCKIEMQRIQRAINQKEIEAKSIIAINLGENKVAIENFYRVHQITYPYVIDINSDLARTLAVNATPTIAMIDEQGRVQWLSSGISPTLIFRIEKFLKD